MNNAININQIACSSKYAILNEYFDSPFVFMVLVRSSNAPKTSPLISIIIKMTTPITETILENMLKMKRKTQTTKNIEISI